MSSTRTQGTYTSSTGLWTVGTINNGNSATLTVTATVASSSAKTNTAEVTAADQFDIDSTPNNHVATEDDQASATVTPPAADLKLTKTVDDLTPGVGQTVVFTVKVSDLGPSNATGVIVKDLLPTGFTYVSSTKSQGTYVSATGIWTVGSIANGATATLTVTATVKTCGSKTNTAEVTASDQPDPDSTPNNHNAAEDDQARRVTVTVQDLDLFLKHTVSNATPYVGNTITFTVKVSNAGSGNATGLKIVDLLPGE